MPKVTFVKSARKANPVAQVGESYYWWKFPYSQLTQSEYYSAVRSLIEQISDWFTNEDEPADVEDFCLEIADSIEQIGECEV